MEQHSYSVYELNNYIKALLGADDRLTKVTVHGQISNFKAHSTGHLYLTLKEEDPTTPSVLRAVMFRTAAQKLRFQPQNDMRVVASGQVSVFERDGQYQLYITSMQPDGVGELAVAFEQLKERLAAEGLFAQERKKKIPRIPHCVALVTAPTGAAVRDMIQVITRRFPHVSVQLWPVAVQGDGAAAKIAATIFAINEAGVADLIIAGRGGGSIEDLWAFNEEAVARAIAASKIPVISAVGHETDFTIADFVADLRAPTPSAAAELAVPDETQVRRYLSDAAIRLHQGMKVHVSKEEQRLSLLSQRLARQNPVERVKNARLQLGLLEERLTTIQKRRLDALRSAMARQAGRLEALSPLQVLSRGYALLQNEKNEVITSVSMIHSGELVSAQMRDGTARMQVTGVTEGDAIWQKQ